MIVFIEIGIVLRTGVRNFPTNVTPPEHLKKVRKTLEHLKKVKTRSKTLKNLNGGG